MSLYTLTVDLLAKTGSFERDMGRAARSVERESRQIQRALSDGVARGADDAAAGFRRATLQMVSFGAAMAGVRAAVGRADEWTGMNNRIRLVTDSTQAFNQAQQDVIRIAKSTYQSLDATAGLYQNLAMVQGRLGLSASETARIVETVGKTIAMSGSSAASAQGALIQLSQAFAGGTPRAEEFNSMIEGASALVNALEDGLGVARGGLRAMVNEGKVSAGDMADALLRMSSSVDESFGGMQVRTSQAMTNLGTSLTEMIGRADEATGASTALAAGINAVGENLPQVTAALGAFASVKVTEALAGRLRAMTANIQAERAHAVETLASARALEARTAAQVVDTGMMLRGATTVRQRLTAEAALTKAVQQHTVARQQLAAAEAMAARAGAGTFARAGSAVLGLFGGPVGLAAMVAATAASWLVFRDNTNAASRALDGMTGSLDDNIAKFRELDALQRASILSELKDQVADAARGVDAEVANMVNQVQNRLRYFGAEAAEAGREFADSIGELRAQYAAGSLTASEFNDAVQAQIVVLTRNDRVAAALGDQIAEQGGEVAAAAVKHQELTDKLGGMEGAQRDAEAAVDGATAAMRRQQAQADATAASVGDFTKKMTDALTKGRVELARAAGGEAGALKQEFGQFILDAGGVDAFTPEQLQEVVALYRARRTQLEQIATSRETAKALGRGNTEAERELKRQTESLARYEREAAMAAATLAGPLQEAEERHRQRLAELDAELRKGNISQEAYNTLKAEAADQLERTNAALREQQQAPDVLLGAMRDEVELLGMIGPQRELYRRGLQAERDMREAINRANEAGAGINDQVSESLIRQARGWALASVEMEEAARAAEDWRYTIMGSVEGVADVFADLFSGQIKSTRDFFTELKDLWKRGWWDIVRMSLQQSFVNPIQRALAGMLQGQGFAGAGQSPGLMQAGMRAFGFGGGPQGGGAGWGVLAGGGVSFPGWTTPGAGVGGWGAPGAMDGGGGFGFGGGVPSMNLLTGEFAGGMPYASTALGLYGLYYGATQRGNGGLSSGLAGLSYGAAGIGLGGAIAGGLGAIGTGTGLAGMGAGAMGGAKMAMGSAASSIGGAAWIPVVGWILAAAAVVDMVSGGKLFGTKYQANKITQDLGIGPDGGMASMTVNEVRQRSLFRGRKWRDRELEPTDEQRQAAQDLYEAMERVSRSAASQLGLQTVDIVAGSIRQVYNKKGELQSEMSTVLGQTFEESFEDFASRLTSEQLIAAVGKIDSAASKIAQDWRHSAEVLAAGAEFFMTAASDARNGLDLWSGIGLQGLTDFVERMQMGEESLAQAYQRLAGLAGDYGSFMADINTTLMTDGLNSYQQQALQIERTYRQQVKSANDYAKALGLSGARAEDLAKIEELRAVSMGKLRAQMEAENEAFLGQLALSDLSTLRDDQKLSEAMEQFADAVAGGDTQAAQAAAQAALGFGRSLYASGRDYQALYDQVTGQLRGMQPGEGDLDMGGLADELEAMEEGISRAVFELAARNGQIADEKVRPALDRNNELLGELLTELRRQGASAGSDRMYEKLNGGRGYVQVR